MNQTLNTAHDLCSNQASPNDADGGLAEAGGASEVLAASAYPGNDVASLSEADAVNEIMSCIADALGTFFYAVYHVWIKEGTYVCFREGMESVSSIIDSRGNVNEAFATYIKGFVEPDDQEAMLEFTDVNTLADRLSHTNSISHEYRRLGLGWTRCYYLVSQRDQNGVAAHAIFTVADINAERALAARERDAHYMSQHDVLTGALNRAAFEEATSEGLYAGQPIGFALVDVDNFKFINDEYGHGFGDDILTKVYEAMDGEFRAEDRVFRMGGDEFALVLKGCDPSNWGSICAKFERIHRTLSAVFPDGRDVTLSGGICFGASGYESWMFDAADKGLYHTKEQGRAGCTLVEAGGTALRTWRDCEAAIRPVLALASTSSGTGRIELPHNAEERPRFFCGIGLRKIYGMPDGLSPEEYFDLWMAGVAESYVPVLAEAHREAMRFQNVECTFLWKGAGKEPFFVSTASSGKVEGETDVIYGIHRSLENAHLVEKENLSKLVIDAQNHAYVCSYLVDLQAGGLTVMKQSPEAWGVNLDDLSHRDALAALTRRLVCPGDVDRLLAFLDTDTLADRLQNESSLVCEYLSTTDSGYCRGVWYPVKRDEQGRLVVAMLAVTSLDSAIQEEKRREAEHLEVRNLYYEAAGTMLGTKILAMVLFDRNTGHGRSWNYYDGFSKPQDIQYDALIDREISCIEQHDKRRFAEDLDMGRVVTAVDTVGTYGVTEKYVLSDGSIRYFAYHFARYSHDEQLVFVVVEDATAIHQSEGRSIEDLYGNVPGGLVSYELSEGKLVPIQVSARYLTMFGGVSVSRSSKFGVDFTRLHPDDQEAYMRQVVEALYAGKDVHHVYRVWIGEPQGYGWSKVDAVVRCLADGRRMVYAMYSDVTEMMEAKLELAKTGESLEEALKTSGQMVWEYDILSHTATCYTKENLFGLPRVIEGYPESLASFDIFIPQDAVVFNEAVKKIDEGADEAQCDTRIMVDGEPRWFSCRLYAHRDPASGRRVAMLFVTDINTRVAASEVFNNRMKSLLGLSDAASRSGVYNITKDEVVELYAGGQTLELADYPTSYDELLVGVSRGIKDEACQKEYRERFSRTNLLALAKTGELRTSMDCLFQNETGQTEWMEFSAELVADPLSGEIEAIGSSKNVTELKLTGMLVQQSLRGSYNSASILINGGLEYYLFDSLRREACTHHVDYWGDLASVLNVICNEDEREQLLQQVQRENVLSRLERQEEFRTTFNGGFLGKRCRLEISFSKFEEHEDIILAALRDITDRDMLARLRHDSRHDALTGLYNRSITFARCEQLLQDHPDTTFAIMKLNVRRFRLYNAFFGEAAGDELLREVARQMREVMEGFDLCAFGRMESDIFCAFFPFDAEGLERQVIQVQQRFAKYREDFLLEASIGIYVVTDRSLPVEGMFARASSAAKEGGTKIAGGAWMYNDELERKLNAEVMVASEMQTALDQGQFTVYLQPKFNLQTGQHAGAEALVRWIHPTRGVVSPGMFIPVFERNGFITSLDRYMWEQVCKLIRKWLDEGRSVQPVSVNVSRVSAYSPATVGFLIDLVKRYDVDPGLLELELTESAYIDDPDEIRRSIIPLQRAGFRILMDDFGTGYSSLNTLRNLPVDMLKLDIGFLSEDCNDERGRAVVDSVLAMTRRLGLPVIAEGVENGRQADFLRAAGCEYVQGYYYARPMPVSDYEAL